MLAEGQENKTSFSAGSQKVFKPMLVLNWQNCHHRFVCWGFHILQSLYTRVSWMLLASHDYQPLVVFLTGIQFVQVSQATLQDSEGHQSKLLMNLIQLAHGVLQRWPSRESESPRL